MTTMLNKTQLRKEIERRSSSLTDEQIFGSEAFQELMQAFVTACCKDQERIPVLANMYEPGSDVTAYTDGKEIVTNSGNKLVLSLPDLWERYVGICGFACHESGHVLFTDFVTSKVQLEAWNNPSHVWYPKPFVETKRTLNDLPPKVMSVFLQECNMVQNIMEDIYIENMLYSILDGLATLGLRYLNDEMYKNSNSLEELLELCAAGKITKESVVASLMLQRKSGHDIKRSNVQLSNAAQSIKDEILEATSDVFKIIDEFEYELKPMVRAAKIQEVIIRLMDLLPESDEEPSDQNQDQNEQSQDNGSDGSSEENQETGEQNQASSGSSSGYDPNGNSNEDLNSDELLKAIEEMLKQNGATPAPQGNTRQVNMNASDDAQSEAERRENAENQRELAGNKLGNSDAMRKVLDKALKDIATKMVEHELELNHERELQKEALEIATDVSSHLTYPASEDHYTSYLVNRLTNASVYAKHYQNLYSREKKTADHIYRKLNNILKDRQEQDSDSGYLMGTQFNARDVWHGDGAYFSRPNTPSGQPNVVFGILCDESGSMTSRIGNSSRNRRDVVRSTAILLEDVLRRLDVPVSIVGHTSTADMIVLNPYVDFDTVDENDKYRLCGITAQSCNVDGGAITYMGEKLMKRNESLKIMIVISDGAPCYGSFYNDNPVKDTKYAIETYRKKGIKILGAMLVQDKAAKSLYGDNACFDCTSPEALEKELIKCVKRFVLAQ